MKLPNGDRFFARVQAADLSCPNCGEVILFGRGRASGNAYDKKTAQLTCPSCRKVFIVGLILYPAKKGRHFLPKDQIPTPRQALAIRELIGGMWAEDGEAKGGQPDETHVVVDETED